MRRGYILVVLIIYIISAASFGLLIGDYNEYKGVLVTKRDFNVTVDKATVETNRSTDNYERRAWINITLRFWNNGSTPIYLDEVSYKLYLDKIDESNLILEHKFLLGKRYEDEIIKGGESITLMFTRTTYNLFEDYYTKNHNNIDLLLGNIKVKMGFHDHPNLDLITVSFKERHMKTLWDGGK
ncbi:MAG: hypothetical protein R6U61_04090 [Thermoplasmata archaeon]